MRRRALFFVVEIWLPIVVVALWWFASAASTSLFFPPLSAIVQHLWTTWVLGGALVTDLMPSVMNLLAGYLLALVVGVGAGIWVGIYREVFSAISWLLEFLRAIPAVAILPVAIIALGLGDDMRIAVIAFGAVWPVMLNTIAGIQSTDQVVLDVAAAYRLRPIDRLLRVRLPSAAPLIFAGARTALAIAVVLIVVSEMFGASRGIGFAILAAQRAYAITDMWAGILVLAALGYILNLIFRAVEDAMLAWHPNRRARAAARPVAIAAKEASA